MGTVLVGGEGGLLIYMTFFATTDPIERLQTQLREPEQKTENQDKRGDGVSC